MSKVTIDLHLFLEENLEELGELVKKSTPGSEASKF
jgi:hypothetical protein